jgi:TetR/AcrR family transcriptional regulator, tetracycline repressor protein
MPETMSSRPQTRALDRDEIVRAAFALLDARGLDSLSMRELAAALSVQAPALYWHVRNKGELVGLMAASIYQGAYASVPESENWRSWLIGFGRALRTAFGGWRDGAKLCAIAMPVTTAREAAAVITAPLIALGLGERQALSFQASVISLTIGWAIFEENGPMHAFLDEMMDCAASFEQGLQALVAGFSEEPA